jgi:hypothetical protein
LPFAGGIEKAKSRDAERTAIQKLGVAAQTDKPSPGARADQFAQASFAKIIGKSVAAGARIAVDQADFGSLIEKKGVLYGSVLRLTQ